MDSYLSLPILRLYIVLGIRVTAALKHAGEMR